ncbi:MAG: VWA domain-containing protein [Agarilytica sp.]
MNEDDLKQALKHSESQPIDPTAKRRVIASAMSEFSRVNAELEIAAQTAQKSESKEKHKNLWTSLKGFLNPLRLIGKSQAPDRKNDMAHSKTPWLYGSLAGVSVVLFAGFIVVRTPLQFNQPEQLPIREYAELSKYRARPLLESESNKKDAVEEIHIEEIIISDDALVRPDISMGIPMPDQEIASSAAHSFAAAPKRQLAERKSKMASMPAVAALTPQYEMDQSIRSHHDLANTERFEKADINPVKLVSESPVSTFSVDVDTASYSFVRNKLKQGVLPNPDSVRVEEFLNYFDYDYPVPKNKSEPFSTHVLVGDSPWKVGNKLIHIGIKGYEITEQPKSNMVFLLDVSGSMSSPDKLPLVKQSISLLLNKLRPDDTVAIVVYAGAAGTVLAPTPVKEKQKILNALNQLNAGGSTAGAQGIKLAYQLAEQNFDKTAVNRIMLATDGDFNVGISDPEQLKTFVERKRDLGIYLSVLGFGQGNYHDTMMQTLAQNGNGVAAYIDTLSEAQKVLVNEATSSLFTIAKDVKIQVEFNPATVSEYRLIGYETRHLNREDFNNDKVDAGDIGAGHTVTAIYEITPVGEKSALIDKSRYEKKSEPLTTEKNNEYALLKLRYKLPKETDSKLLTKTIATKDTVHNAGTANTWQRREFQFSSAVAGFAQLIKDDKYLDQWTYDDAIALALKSRGEDEYGYRNELVQLVRAAKIAK